MTTEERLEADVRKLAAEIGERNVFRPEAYKEAERYIAGRWSDLGYEVVRYPYNVEGVECANLEVTVRGRSRPGEIILLGAHYDSVDGSPGANDNGSGVAALLEISQALAGEPMARTVRFVAFANEEPPFFYSKRRGSRVYVRMARKRGDKIAGMISLETIGYYTEGEGSQEYPPFLGRCFPDRGNYVAFVSNILSRGLLRKTVDAFKACSDFPAESLSMFTALAPGAAWSDHSSFWESRYHALMVTDTAFYRYPYYHTSKDTPDRINYPAFARVVEGLTGAVRRLANSGGL